MLFAGAGERGRPPGPWVGLVAFALAGVAAYYGSWLPERLGVPAGVVLMQVGAFLLPVFVLARLQGIPLRDTLSWRWPGGLNLLGCGLVGVSASVAIAGLILRLVPPPEAELQGLSRLLVLGQTPGGLALAWAVLALTPAICEETLFRGLILASLRRWGAWGAILGSALLFGLAHASIYRLLPTAALGVVFGYAVWRTGSLPCSMVMHALNNGLIATLVWWQARTPGFKLDEIATVPWPLTLGAAAVAAAGVALLRPAADAKGG